jgi:DNA polymerase III epsilon subunit-like protein
MTVTPLGARDDDTLPEIYISVDVETAGPNPGTYALLSIGACVVGEPERGFYVELTPDKDAVLETSMAIGGLTMEYLAAEGVPPHTALLEFEQWLEREVPPGHRAVFVGFNAPFDWMFVSDYFWRYLGRNPFGHSAVDVKAYYMGMTGSSWASTSLRHLSPLYLGGRHLSHNALGDARDQGEIFRALLTEATALRVPRD